MIIWLNWCMPDFSNVNVYFSTFAVNKILMRGQFETVQISCSSTDLHPMILALTDDSCQNNYYVYDDFLIRQFLLDSLDDINCKEEFSFSFLHFISLFALVYTHESFSLVQQVISIPVIIHFNTHMFSLCIFLKCPHYFLSTFLLSGTVRSPSLYLHSSGVRHFPQEP